MAGDRRIRMVEGKRNRMVGVDGPGWQGEKNPNGRGNEQEKLTGVEV